MSGIEETAKNRVFGPVRKSRLDLMGIRFMVPPVDDPAGGDGGNSGYTPPATQDELDRIITDRLTRERAKFEGFEDFKAKAAQFDAIKDKPVDDSAALAKFADLETRLNATETRAAAAEAAAAETAVANARLSVAAEKGISKDHLPLLTAATREELVIQADAILKLTSGSGRVPGQGARGTAVVSGTVASGREIFENSRSKSKS